MSDKIIQRVLAERIAKQGTYMPSTQELIIQPVRTWVVNYKGTYYGPFATFDLACTYAEARYADGTYTVRSMSTP